MTGETDLSARAQQVLDALKDDLPPVTLLLGDSVAAFGYMGASLAAHYGVHAADILKLYVPVSTADARNLVRHADVAPFGPFKLALVLLDEASAQAQNILLKLLEEPPETIRFLLVSVAPPLPTIVSRSRVYRFGAPGTPVETEGPSEAQAKVAAAVRAAVAGDKNLLLTVCQGFDAACISELRTWAARQARQVRPELYGSEVPEPAIPVAQARRVLTALSAVPRARPVNAAVAALSAAFD